MITISDASDLNAAHIKADADMVVIKNNDDMTELTRQRLVNSTSRL